MSRRRIDDLPQSLNLLRHRRPIMPQLIYFLLRVLFWCYLSLSTTVNAAGQAALVGRGKRTGYRKGDLMPVSCLNRTMWVELYFLQSRLWCQLYSRDTGEHVRLLRNFPAATLAWVCPTSLQDSLSGRHKISLIEFLPRSPTPMVVCNTYHSRYATRPCSP